MNSSTSDSSASSQEDDSTQDDTVEKKEIASLKALLFSFIIENRACFVETQFKLTVGLRDEIWSPSPSRLLV